VESIEKRFERGVFCANLTPVPSPPAERGVRRKPSHYRGEVNGNKTDVCHKAQGLLLLQMWPDWVSLGPSSTLPITMIDPPCGRCYTAGRFAGLSVG